MNIIIVGCGRVGSELARLLSSEGHNVVIIDRNSQSFNRLGGTFNGLTLVGNGVSPDTLKTAGIEKADAFCAVTNGDNTNIMAAQVAKKMFKVPKVIARVYDPRRAEIYKILGLDILSGTVLFAAMLRDKIVESKLSSFLIETGELGVLEFDVVEKLNGKTVEAISIKGEFIVTAVIKHKTGAVIMPEATTVLHGGDGVIGVAKIKNLAAIKKTLGINGE